MSDPKVTRRPFGTWPSVLSAEAVASASIRRSDVQVCGDVVFWSERRPQEGGRSVIVACAPKENGTFAEKIDVVSPERNVRSDAHEYGGGCSMVLPVAARASREERPGSIVFVDRQSQSIVHGSLAHGAIESLTSESSENRVKFYDERTLLQDSTSAYADFVADPTRDRVVCVREHYPEGVPHSEAVASLVAITLDPGDEPQSEARLLVDSRELGLDFVASPRVSPDGKHLAFVGWKHPYLPWDESELWIAELGADGDLGGCENPRRIAGGAGISIFQPEWSPDGKLHFVSDQETGWWNIHRIENSLEASTGEGDFETRNLTPIAAEFGLPQWVFAMSTYKVPRPDLLVAVASQDGSWSLGHLDPRDRESTWIPFPTHQGSSEEGQSRFTFYDSVAASATRLALLAAGPRDAPSIATCSLGGTENETNTSNGFGLELIDHQPFTMLDEASIAVGQPIEFDSPHPQARLDSTGTKTGTSTGTSPQRTCHAFYYPPTNSSSMGVEGTRPPLIVKSHGGPTAATNNALDPAIQFWTSRGFALVDVNYGGSTGYGRAYRDLLNGLWGVVDVEDCATAALQLADRGLADPDRLIIRGGSAGGYTTLAALAFTDIFCAGASLYGIGDLEQLVRDTHKFESRYLDRMIGPYPEGQELYRARSPIHAAERLSCPVIFFQGSDDKVVPPNQSETMVEALRAKGVPTDYVLFQGEGHGFRKRENIVAALEKELEFYNQQLG